MVNTSLIPESAPRAMTRRLRGVPDGAGPNSSSESNGDESGTDATIHSFRCTSSMSPTTAKRLARASLVPNTIAPQVTHRASEDGSFTATAADNYDRKSKRLYFSHIVINH